MAAMIIFGRSVDSEKVEEVLSVASPETRFAVQQFLDTGTELTRLTRYELDGLLSGYAPQSIN
jgi:hypothetical protein